MERLQPYETDLIGDEAPRRIDFLVQHVLERLGNTDGGWSTLYRDPEDSRLWELTYPDGSYHGGGLPRLHVVSAEEAWRRYGVPSFTPAPLTEPGPVIREL